MFQLFQVNKKRAFIVNQDCLSTENTKQSEMNEVNILLINDKNGVNYNKIFWIEIFNKWNSFQQNCVLGPLWKYRYNFSHETGDFYLA